MKAFDPGTTQKLENSLETVLEEFLEDTVYIRDVPADREPPWCVFSPSLVSQDGDIYLYDLLVEVTGYIGQEAMVLAASDAIRHHLDAYAYTGQGISWQTFPRSCAPVESTDPELTRCRIYCDLRLMEV